MTVFYSPDYQLETDSVWTIETSFAQVLPKVSIFTPTFSALVGYQAGDDAAYKPCSPTVTTTTGTGTSA